MGHALHRRQPTRRFTAPLAILIAFTMALVAGIAPTHEASADDAPTVASGQLPLTGAVGVHDPTMVYDEGTGRYVVAASHNSIRSAPTMNGPWTNEGTVSRAAWTFNVPNSGTLWAPHLHRIGETYYYFYSQSSFGSQNSGIGVKTTPTPTVPSSYVDQGEPIIWSGTWNDPDWDDPIDHNAIDPAVLQDEDGQWWIVWGSHWDGIVVQRIEFADDGSVSTTGDMTLVASRAAANNPIEGPAVFHRNGYYYLLSGWDSCCAGANSTYKVTVGRSESIDGPYVDKNGVALTEGGGTTILDSRVAQPGVTPTGLYRAPGGPDVWVEDDVVYMVYHAYRPQNTLAIRPMDWHDDWPYFQEPGGGPYDLTDGAYHRLVSEAEPFDMPDIERVPGPDGFGDAVRLNGPSPVGFVEMPEGIVSDLDGDFAISMWVNRATTSGQNWTRLFDFGDDTSNFMFLTPSAAAFPNGLRLSLNPSTADGQQIPGTVNGQHLPLGWQHVVVTASGTTGTIYLNGELYRTNENFTLRPADLGLTANNWIGRSQFEADAWLNGTVDDFNIFSRALSQEEAQALMAEPGGGEAVGGGDVAWYRFDEDGGELVEDSSGSGNHARAVVPTADENRLQNPVPGDQCLTAVVDGEGFNVIQRRCDDDEPGQIWRLDREADGFHRFRSTLGGGRYCLEMADASGDPGTNVVTGRCDDSELQHWHLDDTGHGFHRPVVKAANLALEIENDRGAIATNVLGGVPAVAPIANKYPPQQWMLSRVSMSADQVLDEFDRLVAEGELVGVGRGSSAGNRLAAFRNQLVVAVEQLDDGDYAGAHGQLTDLSKRLHVSGAVTPSHFVSGSGSAELDALIGALMHAIG